MHSMIFPRYSPMIPSTRSTKPKNKKEGAHDRCPACLRAGVKQLTDESNDKPHKSGCGEKYPQQGGDAQGNDREVPVCHPQLDQLSEGVIGRALLPLMMFNGDIRNIAGNAVKDRVYVGIVVGIFNHFIPYQFCYHPVVAGYNILGTSQQNAGGHFVEFTG